VTKTGVPEKSTTAVLSMNHPTVRYRAGVHLSLRFLLVIFKHGWYICFKFKAPIADPEKAELVVYRDI